MSNYESQGRTPTIMVITSGSKWELDASKIANEAGIRWVSLASVDELFSLEGTDHQDTCVMIDAQHPDVQWTALHDGMLEKRIEIPVIVVAPEKNWMDSIDSVTHCANFVVTQPLDHDLMLEAVEFAFQNERLVRHRFAVERSYRRLVMLNERERSILSLAVEGSPNKQIARKLGFHIKTIERIRHVAYDKLRVRSTAEMTRLMTLAELYEFIRPLNQMGLR